MRYLPLALLASASSAFAHPPPHELLLPPPLRTTPPPPAMVCADTRGADDVITSSTCEVTSLTDGDVQALELRRDHLTLTVRVNASQADFDKLAAVPFLTYLSILSPAVHDLHALARFKHLVTLGIDVSATSSLTEVNGETLQALTIGGCGKLADLSSLGHLQALVTLVVGSGPCTEIGRLDGIELLSKLATFQSNATIGDGWALAKATALRRVTLGIGPIPLGAIAHMQLTDLSLDLVHATAAELATFEHLAVLDGLSSLDLSMEHEPKLPKLPKLHSLRVYLAGARRERIDLAFVSTLPHLQSLDISASADRAELAPLATLHDATSINIAAICEADAKPLASLAKLQFLIVSARALHVKERRGLSIMRMPSNTCMPAEPLAK